VLLWLVQHGRISIDELADTLEHGSGLLGLAGTPDMRGVLAREQEGDAAAALALAVYLRSLRAHIAAMAAALDGLDVLSFTGGVGERSAELRRRTCAGLGFLGVELADDADEQGDPDREISPPGADLRVTVIAALEDLEIARRHVRRSPQASARRARTPRKDGPPHRPLAGAHPPRAGAP
jgi:acetate kinase